MSNKQKKISPYSRRDLKICNQQRSISNLGANDVLTYSFYELLF